ncbi:ArnT family glycosyltransferase [Rickettsiales endosymbiont of Stachyamoeba lipophora]|uniref:ArnT family glycosyltransferase n=1 Tax=Rickettsiales endosymbiont of Stachyamoeba lipophora TaxID=2486578 RepID=UPI000F64C41A|nr:glycosyltransferase family 39 protein [Rickettsiales endosymbiont of Stachyamoeba lipophora]AZL15208.1 hypothetical protein EF513_01360 [Rickettsiales endosymbiont of Stachyamoeba lipophora]
MSYISKRVNLNLLIAILILSYVSIFFTKSNLFADEAQYWFWSTSLDAGYYSKPPAIAWLIYVSSKLLGNSEFAIRFFSPLLYFITSFMIRVIALRLANLPTAKLAQLIFLTLPITSVAMQIISTDALLLLFWALSLWIFIKLIETNDWFYTLYLGLSFGLGMLSKYSMVISVVCVLMWLITTGKFNKYFIKLFVSSIIAFLVFLPNLLWNLEHNLVSFMHTYHVAKLNTFNFKWLKFLEFVGGQVVALGIVSIYPLVKLLQHRSNANDENKIALLIIICAITPMVIFAMLSLISGANINWTAPSFIAIAILIAKGMNLLSLNRQRIIIYFNILIFLIIKILFILNLNALPGLNRLYGWKEVGREITQLHQQFNLPIMIDDRKLLSWCLYYSSMPKNLIYKHNFHEVLDHYDLAMPFHKSAYKQFLFISVNPNYHLLRGFNNPRIVSYETEITNPFNPRSKFYVYQTARE